LANINVYLGAVANQPTFVPVANASGAVTLTMTTNDGGNTGSGGTKTDVDAVTINVTPVADAPTLVPISNKYVLLEGNTVISTGATDATVTTFDFGAGVTQANLETELGVASGYLDNRFDPTGPNVNDPGNVDVVDGKVTESHFSMKAGTTVTWDFSFTNGENLQSEIQDGYNDIVVLLVTDPSGNKQAILVDSSEAKFPALSSNGSYSYVAAASGDYTFQWLVLNAGDDYKDSSLSLSNVRFSVSGDTTRYSTPIELPILAGLTDTDGSESLSVTISGIPAGWRFDAGVNNGNGSWSFTPAQLAGLHLLPPEDYVGTVNLTVTATATETVGGDSATTSQSFSITVAETTSTYTTSTQAGQTLAGTTSNDLIRGYAGNDTVNAGDGSDIIYGGAGNDTVNGQAGHDYLYGGVGNDTITGGTGNDKLSGGAGADTFQWNLADRGTLANPARDVITDFDTANYAAGGDRLDLRDLLSGTGATTASVLDGYLDFSKQGSDTVINVRPTGAGGEMTQQIVLQGVDLTSNGTLSDQTIIQDLLTRGKLQTD
jgi:Ca2+-binding RTX toxin-like protein